MFIVCSLAMNIKLDHEIINCERKMIGYIVYQLLSHIDKPTNQVQQRFTVPAI